MRTPCSLRGTRAASATFVKTWGDRYARPSNANYRNGLWRRRIDTWKYASIRSIAANQSLGRTHPKMCCCVSILNGSLWRARFKTRRSKIGLNPPLFLGAMKDCKTPSSYQLEGPALSHPSPVGLWFLHARQEHLLPSLSWSGRPWNWEDAGRTESHSRVWWSDGANETDWEALARLPESGTNRTTDVTAVGQRGGMQGPSSGVWLPVQSGVSVCATLICILAEGAWVVLLNALSTPPQLLTGERGGWVWIKTGPSTTPQPLWGPRDRGNCSFVEVLGTIDHEASGKKKYIYIFSVPAFLRGREWCVHLPKSILLHLRVARLRVSCASACLQVWREPGRAEWPPCDRHHGAAYLVAAAFPAREWWLQHGAALSDE